MSTDKEGKLKAAVFASGSGTNLEALLEKQKEGLLNADIVCVVADKENAYARERADNHGIAQRFYNPKAYPSKKEYEQDILKWLKEMDVDLIVLAGYMRFIGEVLLEAYPQAIVNIHPAFLPEFPGAHGIADAWNSDQDQSGVTIHYVDEGVDTGPVIVQERVAIDRSHSFEDFEKSIHAKEYGLFYRGINHAVRDLKKKQENKMEE